MLPSRPLKSKQLSSGFIPAHQSNSWHVISANSLLWWNMNELGETDTFSDQKVSAFIRICEIGAKAATCFHFPIVSHFLFSLYKPRAAPYQAHYSKSKFSRLSAQFSCFLCYRRSDSDSCTCIVHSALLHRLVYASYQICGFPDSDRWLITSIPSCKSVSRGKQLCFFGLVYKSQPTKSLPSL